MPRRLARRRCVALAVAVPLLAAEPLAAAVATDPAAAAVRALNAVRRARGLPPLLERHELSAAARGYTRDLAARGSFTLELPGSPSLRDRLARAGYIPSNARFLLNAGYPSGELLVESLLDDDAAAGPLLDPVFGEIGIGHTAGPYRMVDGRTVTHAWLVVLAQTRFPPVTGAADGLVSAINAARRRRGLAPVAPVAELTAAAADHARDMTARGFFDHRTPDGSKVDDRTRRRHYDYRKVGENLAAGLGTPGEVVQGWTDSPGHAAVMYDRDFHDVGVAYLPGPLVEPGRSFGHIWVAVFGLRK